MKLARMLTSIFASTYITYHNLLLSWQSNETSVTTCSQTRRRSKWLPEGHWRSPETHRGESSCVAPYRKANKQHFKKSYLHRHKNGCLLWPESSQESLSLGVADVAVLNAQDRVRARAPARALLQEVAAGMERRRHAILGLVTRTPGIAELLCVPLAGTSGAVPQHLLRPEKKEFLFLFVFFRSLWYFAVLLPSPCAIAEDVPAVERVDGNVVLHSTIVKNGVPAVEQNLILRSKHIASRADSLRLGIIKTSKMGFLSKTHHTFRLTIGSLSLSLLPTMLWRSWSLDERKARNVPFIPMAWACVKHR